MNDKPLTACAAAAADAEEEVVKADIYWFT